MYMTPLAINELKKFSRVCTCHNPSEILEKTGRVRASKLWPCRDAPISRIGMGPSQCVEQCIIQVIHKSNTVFADHSNLCQLDESLEQ